MTLNAVTNLQAAYSSSSLAISSSTTSDNGTTTSNVSVTQSEEQLSITATAALYVPSDKDTSKNNSVATYKPDMDKVRAMKAETDQRMLALFGDTVDKNFLKQIGGLRGLFEKLKNGEKVDTSISATPEAVAQAQADVADDGYWGVNQTSDRFIEFAKALSGGDPSKIEALKDAFKEGYKKAEEAWGGKLPELSKKTYDATLEKFDKWASEGTSQVA